MLEITMKLGGTAFALWDEEQNNYSEDKYDVASIADHVRKVADSIEMWGSTDGGSRKIIDSNGNCVGEWRY